MEIISAYLYYIVSAFFGFCCCCGVPFILFIVGFMVLRKKGKTEISAKEAVVAGVDQVSRAFVRTGKSREEMIAEEDAEEDRNRRR